MFITTRHPNLQAGPFFFVYLRIVFDVAWTDFKSGLLTHFTIHIVSKQIYRLDYYIAILYESTRCTKILVILTSFLENSLVP